MRLCMKVAVYVEVKNSVLTTLLRGESLEISNEKTRKNLKVY